MSSRRFRGLPPHPTILARRTRVRRARTLSRLVLEFGDCGCCRISHSHVRCPALFSTTCAPSPHPKTASTLSLESTCKETAMVGQEGGVPERGAYLATWYPTVPVPPNTITFETTMNSMLEGELRQPYPTSGVLKLSFKSASSEQLAGRRAAVHHAFHGACHAAGCPHPNRGHAGDAGRPRHPVRFPANQRFWSGRQGSLGRSSGWGVLGTGFPA